jgi:hypothetical protein
MTQPNSCAFSNAFFASSNRPCPAPLGFPVI